MNIKILEKKDKDRYSKIADHFLQTWEWGQLKEKQGQKCFRIGIFENNILKNVYQLFIKKIPRLGSSYGYVPRSPLPDPQVLNFLEKISRQEKCIFTKYEPDVVFKKWENKKGKISQSPQVVSDINFKFMGLVSSKRIVMDNYSFVLKDLQKTKEEEIMKNMHNKTRYNIRLATKKGVTVEELNNDEGIDTFLRLNKETTKRQKFYQYSNKYFKDMIPTLGKAGIMKILAAKYKNEYIVTWILFLVKNRLFYVYGASSRKFRNVMASNLICWEAIKFGIKNGCFKFDLWGSLGPNPNTNHPWYGFHRFKQGYGGDLIEYVGSYDAVYKPMLYKMIVTSDWLKWKILNLVKR